MNFFSKLLSKRNIKNRPIFVLCGLFIAAFLAMGVNIFIFVNNESYNVISSEYNPRQALLAKQNIRGDIINESGQVLATTVVENGVEKRTYPYNNLFAHSVGYSTYGTYGIEDTNNMALVTSSMSVTDKVRNDINSSKNTGDTVVCTLNVALQESASKYLGMFNGAVIVSDVKTGKILAMVSHPDFDPNYIDANWNDIVENDKNAVLLNRVTQGIYPPGSTFKIIDLLEYIRENPGNYDSYSYSCGGRFSYGDKKIKCYHGMNHGTVSLRQSFAKSCNCSFANIGTSLDTVKWEKTLGDLLFGKDLPVNFSYKKSVTPIGADADIEQIVQGSIGQGQTGMTPLHLNLITNAIANDGVLMKPLLVTGVQNVDENVVKSYSSSEYGRIMTSDEAQILNSYMQSVVTDGTGHELKNAGYLSAGKTGSAEYGGNKGDSHAWFTGFAPADDPRVSVTIIVEGAGSGGDYAVPLAKRLFDTYFEEYGSY